MTMNNLLSTKFHIPSRRGELVRRARLFSQLDQGLGHKITLISTPAGYGKTTLASSWAGSQDPPGAWLSLDSEDNDSARFFSYLYAALAAAYPRITSQVLPVPETLELDQAAGLAANLGNALAALTEEVTIFLDDYHNVHNGAIHAFLQHLVEHLPAHAHLYLLTRIDPPLPLARWRGRRELLELRSFELRFSSPEIKNLMGLLTGLDLSAENLAVIEAKTEGWATALVLAALSLNKQSDVQQFIHSFDGRHEYIADYLTEEVLAGLPAAWQSFLLQTSILQFLSKDLCDAVTRRDDSQVLLAALERENIFLYALDPRQQWYRYHPLFRELLQKRLQQMDPGQIQFLYSAASRWHEEHQQINQAVYYAQAGSDNQQVHRLIEAHILDTVLAGEFYQAQTWLDLLPPALAAANPVFCIAQAWVAIRNRSLAQVRDHLQRAENLLAADAHPADPGQSRLRGHLAALKAVIARTAGQSPEQQQEHIHQALAVIPADNEALRGLLKMRLGFCYLDLGREQEAERLFEQLTPASGSNGSRYNYYGAVYARTVLAHLQGRLQDVRAICEAALQQSRQAAPIPWQATTVQGYAHIALGMVQLEWNQLDSAEYHLQRGLTLNAASGLAELQVKGTYAMGRLFAARGEPLIPVGAHRSPGDMPPSLSAYAAALQAHLWLLAVRNEPENQDLIDRLVQWAETQSLGQPEGYDLDWQVKRQLIFIRAVLALAEINQPVRRATDLEGVAAHLAKLEASCQARGWVDRVLENLIVRSLVLKKLGQVNSARESLKTALALAKPPGYLRIFLEQGGELLNLLYELSASSEPCASYARQLLSQAAILQRDPAAQQLKQDGNFIEALTAREIEVLTLVAAGLTNREIGLALSISPGTVKRHTANINSKLNAHNRTQAVAIARTLAIID